MIARPKPQPDDTPTPELVTPTRLARELVAIATAAQRLRIRSRSLALYFAPTKDPYPTALDRLAATAEQLAFAADRAVDLATAIRVGQVLLDERYLDPACRPERPLLDLVEHAPTVRAAAAIAPAVAARMADGPTWADDNGESWAPPPLVALPSASAADVDQLVGQAARRCRVCGCTDADCSQCIELTGGPCHWVEANLCSACVDRPVRVPPEHPAAGPARQAAKKRSKAGANGRKGGGP